MTSPDSPPRAGRTGFGPRLAVLLLALLWPAQLLPMIGLLAGNAQADVALHFHTTQIAWFTLITALVATFATPFVVKAADLYGKRRLMLVVTALGLIGDLIAALAPTYEVLLIGRGLAGVYGAVGALVFAITRDLFPPRLVGVASGLIGAGVGVVAVGGPFLSGWLIDDFGFRGVLWFLVLATALSLVLLIFVVPESPVRGERTGMDWAGGLLLGGGMTAVVYAIGKGAEWGWTSGKTIGFLAGGGVALVLFLIVEKVVPNPMFDLGMLARRQVWTALLATSIIAASVFAGGTVSQLLGLFPKIPGVSDGLGFSATKLAVIGIPSSVLLLAAAVATGVLARRIDARLLLVAGAVLGGGGLVLMSQYHYTVPQLVLTAIPFALGMGSISALVPILIIEAVTPKEQALANGMQGLLQGVVAGVVTQLLFVVMAQHGTVLQGTQFYQDKGFTYGYLLPVAFVAVGVLVALLIPRTAKLDEVEAGAATAS
ncbi:MFS transporter [Actinocorallia populi]|uniref:MFS transporter n=1 Tax=Actinocorallia populi TaxID=2079200 RepID=UPI000D088DBF|nr:MFS transporter [Actinocorallia populi]